MEQKISNQEYNEYVEQITPTYSTWKNCLNAFWVGGLLCVIGECFFFIFKNYLGLPEEDAASYESILLILGLMSMSFAIFVPSPVIQSWRRSIP